MAVVYIPLVDLHECRLPITPSAVVCDDADAELFSGPRDTWGKQAFSGVFFECDGCTKVYALVPHDGCWYWMRLRWYHSLKRRYTKAKANGVLLQRANDHIAQELETADYNVELDVY